MVIKEYEELVYDLVHSKHTGPIATLPWECVINLEYVDLPTFYRLYVDQAEWLMHYERPKECPMPRVSAGERKQIYNIEKYERDMILADLKFATHIMMSKYNEPIESRRFLTTNDSCLSFAQVTVTPDCYKWSFVSRSTEVNRMLPADLATIGWIISEWIRWFMIYKPEHVTEKKRGVRISFVLNNPHYYR